MPGLVWPVTAWKNRNEVSDWSPKIHIAGDSFMSVAGEFQYCSIALWKASVLSSPFGPVLLVISLFTVVTPNSSLQLLWGKATEESRSLTPQISKNSRVVAAVNSGLPSDDSSSLILNITNMQHKQAMRPMAPSEFLSTTGQLEYLSTMTR